MSETKPYRHELKYCIDGHTALVLRQRAAGVLAPDAHSGGKYHISNLYFDDQYNTFYHQKQSGALSREKLRVRHYNHDESTLRLECKHREGQFVYKESTPVTPAQYRQMQAGDFTFAAGLPEGFWQKLYARSGALCFRPVGTVEYTREAYVYPPGNVRLTFDTGLQSRAGPGAMPVSLYPRHLTVLELKYDDFLPAVVADLLCGLPLQQQAMSKYVAARDTLWGVRYHDG